MLVGGVDFGRHKDPTVACVLDIDRLPLRLVRYSLISLGSWDSTISKLNLLLEGVNLTLADATGVGDGLYERLPNCVGVFSVSRIKQPRYMNSSRFVISVQMLVESLLETINSHNIKVCCKAPDLERQLKNFTARFTKGGRIRFEAGKKFHDDAVFALALANFAARLSLHNSEVA